MNGRSLPSLSALHAFEATARHASVKRAAAELAVTPTAVSHQLRRLEEALGVRLFLRTPRRLLITADGQKLFPVLRDGFDAFSRAVRTLRRDGERGTVTISATTAFTARWLLPRLTAFRDRWPRLSLNLHASEDPVDLRESVVDVAVRYGKSPGGGLAVEPLFQDTFAPVCSPRLRLRRPADLSRHPLLHFEWRRRDRRTPTWSRWFARAGLPFPSTEVEGGLSFSDESHAIAAAIAGQGTALLSSVLVRDELERGTLVQPFGPRLRGNRYHLVHLPSADRSPAVRAVRTWILDEASRDRSS